MEELEKSLVITKTSTLAVGDGLQVAHVFAFREGCMSMSSMDPSFVLCGRLTCQCFSL